MSKRSVMSAMSKRLFFKLDTLWLLALRGANFVLRQGARAREEGGDREGDALREEKERRNVGVG